MSTRWRKTPRAPRSDGHIVIKRAYQPATQQDGRRFLVERLWPRGIKKEALKMDAWLKDVAPSTPLRQWFGHKPERWAEFRRRYQKELSENAAALAPILDAADEGPVTLLYSAHDVEHNGALVLRNYLVSRQRRSKSARAPKRTAKAPSAHVG